MIADRVLGLAVLLAAVGCGKSGGDEAPGDLVAKVTGTAQLPVSASRTKLFGSGKAGPGLVVSWQSCVKPGDTDQSEILEGGAVLVASTASCTGSPSVTVSAPELIDLSGFSAGSLHFTVEVSAVGQSLEFLVQDGSTKSSIGVDLADHGFDPTKIAVPQPITIPGSVVATNGVDMAHLKRPFQVNLICSGSACQAKFDAVEWWGGEAVNASDAFPIRSGAVGLLQAASGGWVPANAVLATTAANGAYATPVTIPATTPAFVVVADKGTGFNFLAFVPTETLSSGEAEPLTVDVDLATTLAAMVQFPGGNADAEDFFEHPRPGEFTKTLTDSIRAYLEVKQPTSADAQALLPEVLTNPSVLQVLNKGRQDAGRTGDAQAAPVIAANQASPPQIKVPTE